MKMKGVFKVSVRDDVLLLLEKRKGESVSGEEIAKSLSVSRNAVWKAVNTLRNQGYPITAVTNRGYCLENNAIFSAQSVVSALGDKAKPFSIEVVDEITSTNTVLKERARNGEKEGTVLIALSQTEGRGRVGRRFESPMGTGLYMSILLRPKMPARESLFLTTATAVAVARAVEEISGRQAGIKWVNDIWLGRDKVCGILTEASFDMETGGLEYAVVGLGVNISDPEGGFPEELRGIAGSVFGQNDVPEDAKTRLAASILTYFWDFYEHFEERTFWQEYCDRSIIVGREITILGPEPTSATAIGIDEECGLIVKLIDGTIKTLSSGEVSVRPAAKGESS